MLLCSSLEYFPFGDDSNKKNKKIYNTKDNEK